MKNIREKLHMPILVTGVERSGISIVARILHRCGVFTGGVTEMFENNELRKLTNRYYEHMQIPIEGQYPLPDTNNVLIPVNWEEDVLESMIMQGYDTSSYWMYKSSRICQIWPIWNYAFPNAKWVIVRRRTGDIINSCVRTGFMKAFKDERIRNKINVKKEEEGWLWWIHNHEKLFVEMIEEGVNCKIVWPERMLYGDYSQIYDLLDWVGVQWKKELIEEVESLLCKTKNKKNKSWHG
jgi:hypothetical protein